MICVAGPRPRGHVQSQRGTWPLSEYLRGDATRALQIRDTSATTAIHPRLLRSTSADFGLSVDWQHTCSSLG